MISILVTDGEQRAALAAVRSLAVSGYSTYVCSARRRSMAGASRYCLKEGKVSDPLRAPKRFLRDVVSLVQRWQIDTLLPITEASLLAILPERRFLGDVGVPFPDIEPFQRLSDKRQLLEIARAIGIHVPNQEVLPCPEERFNARIQELHFPIVIKPSRSVSFNSDGSRLQLGVRYASNSKDLDAELLAFPDAAYPLLLQERIIGPGIGLFLLFWEDRTLAAFSHRRIREKPPTGGVSVYCESIPLDRDLHHRSEMLLREIGWQGVAMVEYKRDASTGVHYLMEVNGRFWGSLQLAIDAGIDFPSLLVKAALGDRIEPRLHYPVGVRSRWFWGEVDHLLARLRASSRDTNLPPGMPSRLQALGQLLPPWRPGDRTQTFRLSDPAPFLRETLAWLRGK